MINNDSNKNLPKLNEFLDYREYLKARAHASARGALTQWAMVARCQPSYLSQVNMQTAHLLPDQAYRLGTHFGFSELELKYWLLLLDLGRAGSKDLENYLKENIAQLRKEFVKVDKLLERKNNVSPEFEARFYSSWIYSAVHVLTDIEKGMSVQELSHRLEIPAKRIQFVLNNLEREGLVIQESGNWKHTGKETHINKNSPFVLSHHQNWRERAMIDAQNSHSESVHFTSLYAVAKEDIPKLREGVMSMMKSFNEAARKSKSETLVCFNTDVFEV